MSSPSPTPSSSALSVPPQYRPVGIVLAIGSGLLIGTSFVFKKKGLLASQKGHAAGEGVAYLKSPMWWTGMTLMILGELCNFAAYAFVEAIIVTPMGALSVVISGLLSHFFLKERLSLFGWISSFQCLLGAAILALNGPAEQSVNTIIEFRHLFVTPWFLSYGGVVIIAAIVIALWVAPKWGKNSMLPYIGVCSLIGGLSVSCTQGLGACILTSIRGENQFKNWFTYFLLVFVVITLITEIYYLNIALAMFNTAMVTPTYYVCFTFCTLVTSVILYKGLKAPGSQIMTIVLAFAVICTGIFILQMSKVDPRKLNVDGHTTLLLEAAKQEADPLAARKVERSNTLRSRRSHRSQLSPHPQSATSLGDVPASPPNGTISPAVRSSHDNHDNHDTNDAELHDLDLELEDEFSEKQVIEMSEEPGLDSLRGIAGPLGTIIRARRRARVLSAASAVRSRSEGGSMDLRSMQSVQSRESSQQGGQGGWLRWSSPKSSRFRNAGDAGLGSVSVGSDDLEKGEKRVRTETMVASPDEIDFSAYQNHHANEMREMMTTSPEPLHTPAHNPHVPLTSPTSVAHHVLDPQLGRSSVSETSVRTSSAVHFEGRRSLSSPLSPQIQTYTRVPTPPAVPNNVNENTLSE
ncbi:hypothetical protein EUX98_g8212 [Antrodiella citrinella]|uniref:DUF803-domain-containing protein n=1 Tax=Antrodiella citrinella TaxID=2447956 RepID=A0A4S4MAB9_9APHY|nr:hypothetical protein EUX98_g8212 [Antrodiella citrinella]